jgi:hypothetical protein
VAEHIEWPRPQAAGTVDARVRTPAAIRTDRKVLRGNCCSQNSAIVIRGGDGERFDPMSEDHVVWINDGDEGSLGRLYASGHWAATPIVAESDDAHPDRKGPLEALDKILEVTDLRIAGLVD